MMLGWLLRKVKGNSRDLNIDDEEFYIDNENYDLLHGDDESDACHEDQAIDGSSSIRVEDYDLSNDDEHMIFKRDSLGEDSRILDSNIEFDPLYNEILAFVLETRKVSASAIQRKFSLGYNRAARIVDKMEQAGVVSPMKSNGKREIII